MTAHPRLGPALLTAALVLNGCSEPGPPPEEQTRLEQALSARAGGRSEPARAAFEALASSATHAGVRARAARELAEMFAERRLAEQTLAALDQLQAQVGKLPPATIERAAQDLAARVTAGDGADLVGARARSIVAEARAIDADRRRLLEEQVDARLLQDDFAGALGLLREEEESLPDRARGFVHEKLEDVARRSDARAAELLERLPAELARDPQRAVADLDRALEVFRGTRARARLLEARLPLDPPWQPAAAAPDAPDGADPARADDG